MAEDSIIGQRIPSLDSMEKATGEAVYTLDLSLPGMLVGRILRSPLPHARIRHIDCSRARRIPGVKSVITGADTPRIKFGMGPRFADKLPLEDQKVRCLGDEVAAVAAADEDTAEEALAAIRVEYEELPAVFDPLEAMREGAPRLHEHLPGNVAVFSNLHCGDVEKGFGESDLIVEEEFRTPAQAHCCLEVHTIVVRPENGGRFTVWSSNQSPHSLKNRLAQACQMAPELLHVIKPPLGGAFGSKANLVPLEPVAVFLARAAGRPVKIENSREEEFCASPLRHPTTSRLRFGFKKDGRLVAKQATVLMDNGAYNSTGPAILSYNCIMFSALYKVPNVKYQGSLVYTNKVAFASFRGFGTYQAMFGHEVMMDMAAERLGIDPRDLRLINANQPGELTTNKVRITSCGLAETLRKASEKSGWEAKRKKPATRRGIGLACMIHTGASSNIFGANYSGAAVRLDFDGSIVLHIGAADIGQGSNTVLCQMAAEVLGVSFADIRLVQGDTDDTPPDVGTKGSRVTFCGGAAVFAAAQNFRRQVAEEASQMLEANPDDLVVQGKAVFVKGSPSRKISFAEIARSSFLKNKPLSGHGFFNQGSPVADPTTGYGYEAPAMIFATQIAEVEVDPETGLVWVVRFISVHDVGRIINPLLAEGQAEGGIVQGLGGALLEGAVFDEGRMVNGNFTDYKLFTSMNRTQVETHWVETRDPDGPFGAKGFSEAATIAVAPAVANAIYHAVGVRMNNLPISSESLLRALQEKERARRQAREN